jgi:hypothetical protein
MSRGKNLQEMETGTKQSNTAVNAGSKSGDPMPKLTTGIPDGQTGSWEDLGGPTPENYTNDPEGPAKLKDAAAVLQQVRNVVNAKAKAADPMPTMKNPVDEESEYDDEDEILEAKEDDEDMGNESPKSKKGKMMKGKKGKDEKNDDYDEESCGESKDDEDDEDVKEELQMIEDQIEEDVAALLSGEDLSEEFKFKARTVFEAALNARTEQIEEAIIRQYEDQLSEEIQEITEALTERVDAYLEYVADEWITENALAIETGIKAEMTESFLNGMKELFEDHYVTIPEDRYDVLESMVEKLDDMETKLNEQIERNVALNQRLAESATDVIFAEVAEGLAISQKDKLASLAENVEFDGEGEYREKLVTLRESYFPTYASAPTRNRQDYLVEETTDSVPYSAPTGVMEAYVNAFAKVSKK